MKHRLGLMALLTCISTPLLAADLSVEIELPAFNVPDYRRPYVAVWLERPDNSVAANLAVWYDLNMRDDKGTEWLKDMRQWWRRIGRELQVPIDGVTSATRAPGHHSISFTAGQAPLGNLPAGEYRLIVEASREHGGRELVSVPLQWPPASATETQASGQHELGDIKLRLTP